MSSQHRVDYLNYLASLSHAPADSVKPIPAPPDEDIRLVEPNEHGLNFVFQAALCCYIKFNKGDPMHHDWFLLQDHGDDAKFYVNTSTSRMHQGLLAELMWQAEMQEESTTVLRNNLSACKYIIALELPVGETFEDLDDIKKVAFECEGEHRTLKNALAALSILEELGYGTET